MLAGEQLGDLGQDGFLVDRCEPDHEEADAEDRRGDASEAEPRGEDGDGLAVADELHAGEAHGADEDDAQHHVEELQETRPPEVGDPECGKGDAADEAGLFAVGRGLAGGFPELVDVDRGVNGDDEAKEDREQRDDVGEVLTRDVAVDELHRVASS